MLPVRAGRAPGDLAHLSSNSTNIERFGTTTYVDVDKSRNYDPEEPKKKKPKPEPKKKSRKVVERKLKIPKFVVRLKFSMIGTVLISRMVKIIGLMIGRRTIRRTSERGRHVGRKKAVRPTSSRWTDCRRYPS